MGAISFVTQVIILNFLMAYNSGLISAQPVPYYELPPDLTMLSLAPASSKDIYYPDRKQEAGRSAYPDFVFITTLSSLPVVFKIKIWRQSKTFLCAKQQYIRVHFNVDKTGSSKECKICWSKNEVTNPKEAYIMFVNKSRNAPHPAIRIQAAMPDPDQVDLEAFITVSLVQEDFLHDLPNNLQICPGHKLQDVPKSSDLKVEPDIPPIPEYPQSDLEPRSDPGCAQDDANTKNDRGMFIKTWKIVMFVVCLLLMNVLFGLVIIVLWWKRLLCFKSRVRYQSSGMDFELVQPMHGFDAGLTHGYMILDQHRPAKYGTKAGKLMIRHFVAGSADVSRRVVRELLARGCDEVDARCANEVGTAQGPSTQDTQMRTMIPGEVPSVGGGSSRLTIPPAKEAPIECEGGAVGCTRRRSKENTHENLSNKSSDGASQLNVARFLSS